MKESQIIKDINTFLQTVKHPARFILLEEYKMLKNITGDIKNLDTKLYIEFKETCLSYNYIEFVSNGIYKFSAKGYEARSAGGHFKYLKSIKPKMTKFERLSLIVAVFAIVISALTYYNESKSKSESEELIKRIEVLEKQIKK